MFVGPHRVVGPARLIVLVLLMQGLWMVAHLLGNRVLKEKGMVQKMVVQDMCKETGFIMNMKFKFLLGPIFRMVVAGSKHDLRRPAA